MGGWPLYRSNDSRSSTAWESEGAMRLEHSSFGTRISTLLGIEGRRRRPAAGLDRELAELRVTESVLRQALARNKTLLRQKDEAIRRQPLQAAGAKSR